MAKRSWLEFNRLIIYKFVFISMINGHDYVSITPNIKMIVIFTVKCKRSIKPL
ncbi:hypothetical protein MTBBW1_150023 [Desulfamplus magnetovallimortis]|uniref:Uncharacterized protein n=1 Tax=Desulfamplus magnetovallimortis TaxID=1246637 RepID=A0A1W1H8G5_9BACT|nr:hypothetical protein MTBBW1_150023 [Desulfamplus magnetovallimortis]